MTVDKSEDRVRAMFGQIAPRYDRMNHLLSMNVDRYWRWKAVRMLRPEPRLPILDICTGTGDLAFALLRGTQGQAPIVASDFCRPMLAIGERKKVRLRSNGQFTFVQADAQRLPFSDNTFQIVSVAFGLRNVTDFERGLREMVRVCQPGGRVGVLEFSMPQRQPIRSMYRWYFRNVLPRLGQWLARNDCCAYSYLPESVGEFPAGEALADRMREAGLKTVAYHPLSLGIATLYIGVK
jgi:demethylmenaquinone methyltransferase / 2-methoxy-6-polyprenyl-1,4-benzoquinol methylase